MSIVPRDPFGTPPEQRKALYEPITDDMWAALRERYPNVERIAVAMRLAGDVDTCADLLSGLPVSADRLDQEALFESRRRSLVQLRAPIELLNITDDAA